MSELMTMNDLFGGSVLDPVPDPYSVYARLRRESPVMALAGGFSSERDFMITRYDDVRAVLKNDEVYSSRVNAKGIGVVLGKTIIQMDGKEHLRHRNIVTPALAPRALKGNFPAFVSEVAHDIIGEFSASGSAELVEQFTFNFPLRVFTQILGLPVDDFGMIHQMAIDLSHIGTDPGRAIAASKALAEHLLPIVKKRRERPQSDLISRLVVAEVEDERLDDEEVVSFCRLLVSAGAETTYHLIGTALFALLTHREQLDEVRADRHLLQRVLDETLRWETPVQIIPREVLEPVTLCGVELPAGAGLVACLGSANRDESVFPDPERFDIHRENLEHLSFGFGKHYCAGSRLAYMEARVALEALLDELPNLRLRPDEECGVVGVAFRSPNRLPVTF